MTECASLLRGVNDGGADAPVVEVGRSVDVDVDASPGAGEGKLDALFSLVFVRPLSALKAQPQIALRVPSIRK